MFFSGKKYFGRQSAKSRVVNPQVLGERNHRPKNNLTAGKFFYWVALLSFSGVTVYILFFSPFLAITDVRVRGAEKIDPDAVKKEINAVLSGKYLNFLPKNNIIIARKIKLEELLAGHFKLINSVNVTKNFPSGLDISMTEKKPQLIMRSGGSDYVIDDEGIAYEKSDFESDFLTENTLLILEDTGNKKVIVKSEHLSQDYINFILEIKEKLDKHLDLGINQIIKTSSIASGDITLETDNGWKIYLNKDVGSEKELEMLKVVLDNKIGKEKRKELEYIDLRTNNKVYYKFKNADQKSAD